MEPENRNATGLLVRYKRGLYRLLAVLLVLAVVVVAISIRANARAEEKYEQIVADLRNEIDNLKQKNAALSDPTAQYTRATTEITIDLIQSEIKDIGELATIEYMYTNAAKFENPKKVFGVDVPFTTKSFIAMWDGVIKAGILIDEVGVEIDDRAKEIVILMPEAKILSHDIDRENVKTLDEKDGFFNPVKVEDVREFDAVCEAEMEKRAIENGVLEKALENAKGIIEKLVNNNAVREQGYAIRFEMTQS